MISHFCLKTTLLWCIFDVKLLFFTEECDFRMINSFRRYMYHILHKYCLSIILLLVWAENRHRDYITIRKFKCYEEGGKVKEELEFKIEHQEEVVAVRTFSSQLLWDWSSRRGNTGVGVSWPKSNSLAQKQNNVKRHRMVRTEFIKQTTPERI